MGEESEKEEQMDVEKVSESTIGSVTPSISLKSGRYELSWSCTSCGSTLTPKKSVCYNCIRCDRCCKTKCRDDFPLPSEVFRNSYGRRFCIDCLHPECTNPSCKTCKVCRDTSCKKKQCKKKPRALHGTAARWTQYL